MPPVCPRHAAERPRAAPNTAGRDAGARRGGPRDQATGVSPPRRSRPGNWLSANRASPAKSRATPPRAAHSHRGPPWVARRFSVSAQTAFQARPSAGHVHRHVLGLSPAPAPHRKPAHHGIAPSRRRPAAGEGRRSGAFRLVRLLAPPAAAAAAEQGASHDHQADGGDPGGLVVAGRRLRSSGQPEEDPRGHEPADTDQGDGSPRPEVGPPGPRAVIPSNTLVGHGHSPCTRGDGHQEGRAPATVGSPAGTRQRRKGLRPALLLVADPFGRVAARGFEPGKAEPADLQFARGWPFHLRFALTMPHASRSCPTAGSSCSADGNTTRPTPVATTAAPLGACVTERAFQAARVSRLSCGIRCE